ncbi:glycosylphosphatidylinositol anchor biosynthesis [Coniothyrium glycines]
MPHRTDDARDTTPTGTGSSDAPPRPRPTDYREICDSALGVFSLLLAVRIVNALALRTFFQPDEFFQSLEPAWHLAAGTASSAWITWEWSWQLRSSLHPALFAAVYRLAGAVATLCGLSVPAKAELLVAAPKVTQAVFAALLDCYTWKLAEKVFGRRSRTALAALALSVCSPWNWFCSTRTLSNCLETTITAVAICYWPWHGPATTIDKDSDSGTKDKSQIADQHHLATLTELRLSLLLAALACILRPTNVLIWLPVVISTLWPASQRLRLLLVRETLICGTIVLALSVLSDRFYYGVWTLPPLRFLYFNIAQSLAVFYGRNRPDYYFTEGLPLLLTTALPFAFHGVWQSLRTAGPKSPQVSNSSTLNESFILRRIAWTSIFVTVTLSLISHKEVRFLYPVLPFLHVLGAKSLASLLPLNTFTRKSLISLLLAVNILLAGYLSLVHQRGVIDVVPYLRHKHETRNPLSHLSSNDHPHSISNTTVGFLMPCHSTPWRSHLIYPEISAWALTCEPPVNVPLSERSSYLDEADEFYINPGPAAWLKSNMESVDAITASGSRSGQHWTRQDPKFKRKYLREWPQNLVFFAQLEDTLKEVLGKSRYRECWRGFNSHFHDDWRRVGDVVVWCLDGV